MPLCFFEFVAEVINQALIEIFAAEEGASPLVARLHLVFAIHVGDSMIETSKVPPPRS